MHQKEPVSQSIWNSLDQDFLRHSIDFNQHPTALCSTTATATTIEAAASFWAGFLLWICHHCFDCHQCHHLHHSLSSCHRHLVAKDGIRPFFRQRYSKFCWIWIRPLRLISYSIEGSGEYLHRWRAPWDFEYSYGRQMDLAWVACDYQSCFPCPKASILSFQSTDELADPEVVGQRGFDLWVLQDRARHPSRQ